MRLIVKFVFQVCRRRFKTGFLADRNILADQAYNVFSAFPEDAMVRIEPTDIRLRILIGILRALGEVEEIETILARQTPTQLDVPARPLPQRIRKRL